MKTKKVAFLSMCIALSMILSFVESQIPPLVAVPGPGRPEDYAGLDVKDKIVLIDRGEISFVEKAQAAADAGAAAMIVADNGSGLSRMALEDAEQTKELIFPLDTVFSGGKAFYTDGAQLMVYDCETLETAAVSLE